MASLISLSIDVKKFKKENLHKGQYLNVTVALNDQSNDYGKNCSVWLEQTPEEKKAKAKRQYLGVGKTFWSDGKTFVPEKEAGENDDLPF